jgi:DNA repair/transcription protein MET18/MMS19
MGIAAVSRYTISHVVPHLIKLFLDPDEISNRPSVLLLLSDFITAARDSKDSVNVRGGACIPLSPFKNEVLGAATVGLKIATCRRPAIAVATVMITTEGLMSDDELGFIVRNVSEFLQYEPDVNDNARYRRVFFLFYCLCLTILQRCSSRAAVNDSEFHS